LLLKFIFLLLRMFQYRCWLTRALQIPGIVVQTLGPWSRYAKDNNFPPHDSLTLNVLCLSSLVPSHW
jgi:hypothetical protein